MGFALRGEAVVEDLVEAVCFGLVAVYGVRDFFRCVWGLVLDSRIIYVSSGLDLHLKKWFAWPCMGPMPLCFSLCISSRSYTRHQATSAIW